MSSTGPIDPSPPGIHPSIPQNDGSKPVSAEKIEGITHLKPVPAPNGPSVTVHDHSPSPPTPAPTPIPLPLLEDEEKRVGSILNHLQGMDSKNLQVITEEHSMDIVHQIAEGRYERTETGMQVVESVAGLAQGFINRVTNEGTIKPETFKELEEVLDFIPGESIGHGLEQLGEADYGIEIGTLFLKSISIKCKTTILSDARKELALLEMTQGGYDRSEDPKEVDEVNKKIGNLKAWIKKTEHDLSHEKQELTMTILQTSTETTEKAWEALGEIWEPLQPSKLATSILGNTGSFFSSGIKGYQAYKARKSLITHDKWIEKNQDAPIPIGKSFQALLEKRKANDAIRLENDAKEFNGIVTISENKPPENVKEIIKALKNLGMRKSDLSEEAVEVLKNNGIPNFDVWYGEWVKGIAPENLGEKLAALNIILNYPTGIDNKTIRLEFIQKYSDLKGTMDILAKNALKVMADNKPKLERGFLKLDSSKKMTKFMASLTILIIVKAATATTALVISATGIGAIFLSLALLGIGIVYLYRNKPNLFKTYTNGIQAKLAFSTIPYLISQYQLHSRNVKLKEISQKVKDINTQTPEGRKLKTKMEGEERDLNEKVESMKKRVKYFEDIVTPLQNKIKQARWQDYVKANRLGTTKESETLDAAKEIEHALQVAKGLSDRVCDEDTAKILKERMGIDVSSHKDNLEESIRDFATMSDQQMVGFVKKQMDELRA